MQYVIAIGIFQALITIVLLWTNRLRSSADHLLILLAACIGTHLTIKFFIFTVVADQEVRNQMNTFIGLSYGPLLYLYTLKARDRSFIPASRWFVFIPFLLGSIAYFTVAGVLYFSEGAGHYLLTLYNNVSFWVLFTCNLFFTLLSLRIVRHSLTKDSKERNIILKLVYSSLLLSFLSILFYIVSTISGYQYGLLFRSIIYSVFVFQCIVILRHKYNAPFPTVPVAGPASAPISEKIRIAVATDACSENEVIATETVSRRPGLSLREQQLIWEQLEAYQNKHKPFTDSELSLDKLSLATGISKYHISETLNKYAQKNFYQYINEYRIRYTTRQMQVLSEKAIPVNILVLAYDAGFKAKSSFNRYFKEIVGITPSEYLKTLASMESTGVPVL